MKISKEVEGICDDFCKFHNRISKRVVKTAIQRLIDTETAKRVYEKEHPEVVKAPFSNTEEHSSVLASRDKAWQVLDRLGFWYWHELHPIPSIYTDVEEAIK